MLEASIVTATVAFEKSPSGTCTVPVQRPNDPRTRAITRCRTEKCTLEWLLSISQRSVLIAPPDGCVQTLDDLGRATRVPEGEILSFQLLTAHRLSATGQMPIEMIALTLTLKWRRRAHARGGS